MAKPDLVALWEAHCRDEFETRDVDATMATMVSQPYVNHIPTMTGGVGHEQLKRFYAYHFIPVNPPDFRLTPISRTVGTDTIVDEFIVHFTHTARDRLAAAGGSADRPRGGNTDGGHRQIRRRQVGARAYLLGPGFGAGSGRPA